MQSSLKMCLQFEIFKLSKTVQKSSWSHNSVVLGSNKMKVEQANSFFEIDRIGAYQGRDNRWITIRYWRFL